MILSLLKGLGSAILHVKDVRSFLSLLLEKRSQHCLELNKSSQKLSRIEIRILCLLLEVNIMFCLLFQLLIIETEISPSSFLCEFLSVPVLELYFTLLIGRAWFQCPFIESFGSKKLFVNHVDCFWILLFTKDAFTLFRWHFPLYCFAPRWIWCLQKILLWSNLVLLFCKS